MAAMRASMEVSRRSAAWTPVLRATRGRKIARPPWLSGASSKRRVCSALVLLIQVTSVGPTTLRVLGLKPLSVISMRVAAAGAKGRVIERSGSAAQALLTGSRQNRQVRIKTGHLFNFSSSISGARFTFLILSPL